MDLFFLILTILSFSVFIISYISDKRRLINGLLFNIVILVAILDIAYIAISTGNRILLILLVLIFILFLIILVFGIYVLIIGLFINARIVMKRESKSLSNLLTLFLGLALVIHVIWTIVSPARFFSSDINIFLQGFALIEIFYVFSIFNFLMISFLYTFSKPKTNQDFIIVLGSRVIGDRVPPLLANRIDKAIEFYNKQSKVSNPPKIIFSGGKGPDEEIAESIAMQNYAIKKGIPAEDTIAEDNSTNTLQNMKFSKNIMDNLMPNGYNSIFVTNNYHLFRAGLYAKMAGLKSQGLACKTALYFIPNALIREYIAIVVMNKKRHIIVVSIILYCSFILAVLNHIFLT